MGTKEANVNHKIVSCAECKRLKLKCDRASDVDSELARALFAGQFPCKNCVKRGMQAICPDGSIPARPKILMDEAERLTQQNTQLTERMRLLEEALAKHKPALTPNATAGAGEQSNPESSNEDINDSLGTLMIDKEGRSTFLGNTAGMESIFRAQETLPADIPTAPFPDLLHTLGIFSTLHGARDAVLAKTEVYLPPFSVAQRLIGVYYDKAAWLFNPIPHATLTPLLSQIYPSRYTPSTPVSNLTPPSSSNPNPTASIPTSTPPALISVLFMIFAIGAFLEHTPGEKIKSYSPEDTYSPGGGEGGGFDFGMDFSGVGGREGAAEGEEGGINAETYHQLARTALSCEAVLVNPSLENIRALMLMAYYHILRDQNAPQHVWGMIGLMAHMAENIGLHRDPRQWKMPDEAVQERRTLFWEIYFLFILESISLGRPPPFPLDYCDCRLPQLDTDVNNIPITSFASHKYIFASTILSQITRVTLGVNPISYSMILALDRRIRDYPGLKDRDFTNNSGGTESGSQSVGAVKAQMFMGRAMGEMALL
ncbi:hypothetical protein M422DRAFT_250500 [Sphaerobolus stellatus SS14]|uniref:Zn(2)-C6 fungal-type domain-containing protein n=1 Tax=Sphaerobolus stellatus (strain SS14) TaxID=990650 RepID=A0A0C9W2Z3_SPHS4|nr:hypothetical protein M422DRAFT_250500 [Sphaerobolus stellatus SS14]